MRKKLYRNDVILNLIIIVLCAVVPLCIVLSTGNEKKTAVVSIDGKSVYELPLEKNGEFSTNGVTVTVIDGCAKVSVSDCPDGLCMNMKRAENVGDSIICIPNRVSVKIVGDGEKGADVVAG